MTRSGTRALRAIFTTSLLLLAGCTGEAGQYPQTTFEPVSEFGERINALFVNTFWWTIGIMLLVEVLILLFIFRYRERPGAGKPKQIHGHTGLEITWTIIPAIIVVFIAVPTVAGIFDTQRAASEDALQIEVIGHQWWWEFRYPEYGVTTANELVLPVGREVQLKMWSADVVHSFWVPRIGGKRDVNPQPRPAENEQARSNFLLFTVAQPGYYLGQCAEFCGASHAIMRTAALALNEGDFNEWVTAMGGQVPARTMLAAAEQQHGETTAENIPPQTAAQAQLGGAQGPPRDTLTTADTVNAPAQAAQAAPAAQYGMSPTGAPAPGRPAPQAMGPVPEGTTQRLALTPGQESIEQVGHRLFTSRACVACHTVRGTTAQGKLGPDLTRFGARRYVGAGARPNTLENLEAWIRSPSSIKPGVLMPGAREGGGGMPATGLSEDEVKAIAAYLHSLK